MRLGPLFTDLYQLTMAQAYWASGKQDSRATFELFFRKCPFQGEFAVLAGFDTVQQLLHQFRFEAEDIRYLKSLPQFAHSPESFFEALKSLHLNDIEIKSAREGEIVFAREPLMQIKGPLWKVQLLESALLNAINFSTLVATYARRIRMLTPQKTLVEFGLRRAQGPNGAMTATRSAFLGGFDSTSNVAGGRHFGIPVVGTMAHSFVQSFYDEGPLGANQPNRGELAAFRAYAQTFPTSCLLLIDTYDTLASGLPNALKVFEELKSLGHRPLGVRLDSGDLAYLSREARRTLDAAGFGDAKVFVSNELNEAVIQSLNDQGACIDAYGVGTHLVVSADQPALGGVYKLVELNGHPRMKISQQTEKLVVPGEKVVHRMFGKDDIMICDWLTTVQDSPPKVDEEVTAIHPLDPFKRVRLAARRIESLLSPIYSQGRWLADDSLCESRRWSLNRMDQLRPDIFRRQNPTPYKVSLSPTLKALLDDLYNKEAPVPRIH